MPVIGMGKRRDTEEEQRKDTPKPKDARESEPTEHGSWSRHSARAHASGGGEEGPVHLTVLGR